MMPNFQQRINIVRLTPDEGERLRELRLSALKEAPQAFGSSYTETANRSLEEWRKQLVELVTFVAVHEGLDIGMIRGARCEQDKTAADLISLWVAPEMRRQGVGSKLVTEVINWAQGEGLRKLNLQVNNDNDAAKALYIYMGFKARPGFSDYFTLDLQK